MGSIAHSMFHLPLPILEKVLRPAIVYVILIAFLRLFGKRELAQLNPFDLIVLLCLSNTVQNAIIGDDNSLSGGVIGAFALLATNWLLAKGIFRAPKINAALEGKDAILIENGRVDQKAMKAETLTMEELTGVLNKNGYGSPEEVEVCKLLPNGTFFVKGKQPTVENAEMADIVKAIERLSGELSAMRTELKHRPVT